MEHFNGLSPAEEEALSILAEEAAEVIQAVTKIQRYGVASVHPDTNVSNQHHLEKEVGDLLAALRIIKRYGFVRWFTVIQARNEKMSRLPRWTHHIDWERVHGQ
jgi:NTP pyrophosphatase (non-canonical NTP hydrolase)